MNAAKESVFRAAETGDVAMLLRVLRRQPEQETGQVMEGSTVQHTEQTDGSTIQQPDEASVVSLCGAVDEGRDRTTPLHWASLHNHAGVLRVLLDHLHQTTSSASSGSCIARVVNTPGGTHNATPLHWAVRNGSVHAATLLLRHGASVLCTDAQLFTPLHLAAQSNHLHLVLLLLANTFDTTTNTTTNETVHSIVNAPDENGQTALMWSAYSAKPHRIPFPWRYIPNIDPSLSDAAKVVRLLLKVGGASVDCTDKYGWTALHWACVGGDRTVIEMLIRAGASVHVKGSPLDNGWARDCRQVLVDVHGRPAGIWLDSLLDAILCENTSGSLSRWQRLVRFLQRSNVVLFLLPMFYFGCIMRFFSIYPWYIALPSFSATVVLVHPRAMEWCINEDMALFSRSIFLMATLQWSLILGTWLWIVYIIPVYPISITLCLFLMLLVFSSAYFLHLSSTSDPGYIPIPSWDTIKATALEVANMGHLDDKHFCSTCLIRKPLRSKHCKQCGRCVAVLDHHCPWTYNCIGRKNHADFMKFVVLMWLTIVFFAILFYNFLYYTAHSTSSSDTTVSSSCYLPRAACIAFHTYPSICIMFIWMTIQFFMTFVLLLTQLNNIASGLTTNESINYWRYDHFMATKKLDHAHTNSLGSGGECHRHGHGDGYGGRSGGFVNPFDHGPVRNCLEFWRGGGDEFVDVYSVDEYGSRCRRLHGLDP